uniref:Uncharacterized protein MANES_S017200 n=1 Tax=Rhizophora mucronata TaxID=61149 RepID=A0A2P2K1U0_RHIMU
MAESESFGALQVQLHQQKRREEDQNDHPRETGEEDDGAEEEEEEKEEEDEEEERGITELQRHDQSRLVELPSAQAEEMKEPRLDTAEAGLIISENDQCNGSQGNSSSVIHLKAEFKGQVEVPNQKVAASVISQGTQVQTVNQPHASVCQTSLSELSPTSVTQSISSAPSPTLPEPIVSPLKADNASMLGAYRQSSADPKPLTIVTPLKSPIPDGYNWRKYGQKLVKSPKGSRSYYKCTYSNCSAKKIECSDHSGHLVEIVNKGIHSHDPPRKNNSGRENRNASSAGPCLEKNVSKPSIKVLKNSGPASLAKEPPQETLIVPDRKWYSSTGSDENREIDIKEEQPVIEPEPKRRVKKGSLASCSETVVKSGKKPKIVVHAAGDVGISGDGYRWRKYGQKMVKGNLHPRNYYRCTSAGCPVRKHIETAVDNTSAVMITYKGVHDHDMPVPKKRHGPASAPLVAAAASASMSNLQLKKTDTGQNQVTPTQCLVDREGEFTGETLGVGGEKEKAIESARTLLSIGFEIKPC